MGNKNSSERRLSYHNRKRLSQSSDSINILLDNEEINTNYEKTTYFEHKDLKLYFNEKNHFDRQELHYLLKKILFQCEFSSPVKEKLSKGGKVLDVGCGAAFFLLDVAERYPNSKFIGVDLDPTVLPKEEISNLKFIRADMFNLPFPDNEFDLVNVGSIVFSIRPDQVNFLIKEMIRVCKPNGYIEFDETHMTHHSKGVGDIFGRLLYGFALVANSYGADNNIALKLPELLSANPATDNVDYVKRKLVLGTNGGNLGIMLKEVFEWFNNSCECFVNDICRQLEITKEQYNQLIENSNDEIKYTYPEATLIRAYAQKKYLIN